MLLSGRFGITPRILVVAADNEVTAYQCPTCLKIFPVRANQSDAERVAVWDAAIWCCSHRCRQCEVVSSTLTLGKICQNCDAIRAAKAKAKRVEKAEKISLEAYWQRAIGAEPARAVFLYDPDHDKYIDSDELEEHVYVHYVSDGHALPEYMWGVRVLPFRIDLDDLLYRVADDATNNGSAVEQMSGVEELRAAVKLWENAQTSFGLEPDYSVLVDLKDAFVGEDWKQEK